MNKFHLQNSLHPISLSIYGIDLDCKKKSNNKSATSIHLSDSHIIKKWLKNVNKCYNLMSHL